MLCTTADSIGTVLLQLGARGICGFCAWTWVAMRAGGWQYTRSVGRQ